MKRALLLLVCTIAATAATACTDALTPTAPVTRAVDTAIVSRSMVGTVEKDSFGFWLRLDEWGIRLTGSEADKLASVLGAKVMVKGTSKGADGPIEVSEFTVLAVDGQPAIDGILEQSEAGYDVRAADATVRMLVDPPEELTAHVGERVWVAGPDGGPPVAFGVIS